MLLVLRSSAGFASGDSGQAWLRAKLFQYMDDHLGSFDSIPLPSAATTAASSSIGNRRVGRVRRSCLIADGGKPHEKEERVVSPLRFKARGGR